MGNLGTNSNIFQFENIWSNEKDFNQNAEWIKEQEIQNESIATQEWEDINLDEVRTALAKANKWKSPGIDKIPNFWLNVLTETHVEMAQQYNDMMKQPNKFPKWLVQGLTYLLPKSDETHNPKNYRPITCLTTT